MLAELWGTRWKLAVELGRTQALPWPRPTTLPHAGGYQTKVAELSPTVASRPRVQRCAARVPVLHEALQLRAEAVATADLATDAALAAYAESRAPIRTALAAVERQRSETADLLSLTTRYNLEIAEYALAVLPGSTPREALVSSLVINRGTRVR